VGCYPDKIKGTLLPDTADTILINNPTNKSVKIPVIKSSTLSLKMTTSSTLSQPQTNVTIIDGETRKKVSLGKGYSLMDWIRKTRDTPDLSGTRGVVRNVTHDELIKHDKVDDCWMVIYGIFREAY
jgi:hypothetical protein